ncbi:MAG: hypothetical protein M4579_002138 [Chaenotheca gracillima]|nr:MAG: hypothetical protein M4579_002138 [Chaenotheca gracillima]
MSTITSGSSSGPGTTAPWKPLFLSHLSKMPSPEFVLTSLHPSSSAKEKTPPGPNPAGPGPVAYVPRARYCIYRGMWAELPENKHNTAPRNPEGIYESALPTLTSDARMEKVPEVFATSAGKGEPDQATGSGGGGPVEAVFWVKEVMTQWRVRGEAFVVAPDIEDGDGESSGVRTVKSEIGQRMQLKSGDEKDWSWGTELTAHFGNLSPGMRGSFKNPPPGTPVSVPTAPDQSLGQKINDLHDPLARQNFRVMIIRPDEVEQLDLSDPAKARRWRFTYIGEGEQDGKIGDWKKEELWP